MNVSLVLKAIHVWTYARKVHSDKIAKINAFVNMVPNVLISMGNVLVRKGGKVCGVRKGCAQINSMVKNVKNLAYAIKKTQTCVIHGQGNVSVWLDGMERTALVHVVCYLTEKAVTIYAIAKTMLNVLHLTVLVFAPQDLQEKTAVHLVQKGNLEKTVYKVATAKITLPVQLKLDNVIVLKAGKANIAIDLVMEKCLV